MVHLTGLVREIDARVKAVAQEVRKAKKTVRAQIARQDKEHLKNGGQLRDEQSFRCRDETQQKTVKVPAPKAENITVEK